MADFNKAFEKTIGHEGGYVNDPDDPGSITNWGISKKSYPNLDIANLTIDQAKVIYKSDFWDKMNGDQIVNQNVAESIFDFGINAGIGTSASLAQKVIEVDVDGSIGKNTVLALNIYDPELFIYKFAVFKINRYREIIKKRPTSEKYFKGWVNRAVENL